MDMPSTETRQQSQRLRAVPHVAKPHHHSFGLFARRLIFLLMLSTPAALAQTPRHLDDQTACVPIPANVATPAVVACETDTSYRFDVVGHSTSYDKETYRQGLRTLIETWLEGTALGGDGWQAAQIDFFLAVPEAAPAGTQARAVVSAPGLPAFVVFMPWRMEEWTPETIKVGILGDRTYPASFGHSAQLLLIKARAGVDAQRLAFALAPHRVGEVEAFSDLWFKATTPTFHETRVRAAILRDSSVRRLLESVEVNAIVEWIALRARVFSFSLAEPEI